MGNLKIGWDYPPKILFGNNFVSKVMCGSEQVWPKNTGLLIHYERYSTSGAFPSEGFFIPIPKEGFPENVPDVCYFTEDSRGDIYIHFVDPTHTANNANIIELAEDPDNWPYEWTPEMNAMTFHIKRDVVLEQTDYNVQRICLEFSNELMSIPVGWRVSDVEYGEEIWTEVGPDGSGSTQGAFNEFVVRSLGELGRVRLSVRDASRYPLADIRVEYMNEDDYTINVDGGYVELSPSAFTRSYSIDQPIITFDYGALKMLYLQITETYYDDAGNKHVVRLDGNITKIGDTHSTIWFDETSGSGLPYTTSRTGGIRRIFAPNYGSTPYYTIENFVNNTPYYDTVGTDSENQAVYLRDEYLVDNPSTVPTLKMSWTLVKHNN